MANVPGGTWTNTTGDVNVGYGNTARGVLNLSGAGTVNVSGGFLYAGRNGAGTVNVNGGGTLTVASTSIIGTGSTGTGTLNVSGGSASLHLIGIGAQTGGTGGTPGVGVVNLNGGGTLNAAGSVDVGYPSGGAGTLNVADAGTVLNATSGDFNVGLTGTTGTFNLSGGAVNSTGGFLYVGRVGSGTLNVSGGTLAEKSDLIVGQVGTGTVSLGGTGAISTGLLSLGENFGQTGGGGNGSMTVTGGTMTSTAAIIVGRVAGGTGLMTMSGGTVTTTAGNASIGSATTGALNISGGLFTAPATAGVLLVGEANGGSGVINLSGTGAVLASTVRIGQAGTAVGTVNQTGGTFTQTGTGAFVIGGTAATDGAAVGTYTVSAGSLSVGNAAGGSLVVGNYGTGTLDLSGTGAVTTARLFVGNASGGSGVLSQSGGTLTVPTANSVRVGVGGVGVYAMTGGTMVDPSDLQLGYGAAGAAGALYQSGGTINVTGGFPSAGRYPGTVGVFDISGGTFNQAASTTNCDVGEQGTGSLTVRAAGVLNTAGNINIGSATGAAYNGSGTVNLLSGGTIATRAVVKGASQATGAAVFDFNGGTLASTATSPAATFMAGLDAAYVYPAGATVDTTAASVTIGQALLAPAGQGVSSIAVSGGTGFRVAPTVQITGGGGGNATAVATVTPPAT